MTLVPDKTLTRIWGSLADQLGSLAGEDGKLSGPELARTWAPDGKRYYAELELTEPRASKLWMSFALPLAIACAGQHAKRDKEAIRANLEASTFDGEDLDTMGECVETYCAALLEAVRAELGEDHLIVFRAGSLRPPDPTTVGALTVASGRLELGELTSGELELVIPDDVFVAAREQAAEAANERAADSEPKPEADSASRPEADSAPKPEPESKRESDPDSGGGELRDVSADAPAAKPASSNSEWPAEPDEPSDEAPAGPLLSTEELAAIREATSAMVKGITLIVADRASVRDDWRASLTAADVEFELVANHHQVLAACRARNVDVVVVDADACASGGLALLAAIRGGFGVPSRLVVVASLATQSHLVACVAGGASDYFTRPLDDDTLGRVLNPA